MLKPLPVDRSAADANISVITFIVHTSFTTHELAHVLDSLVRVSRRVGGATDLLATDMRPVPRHSKETTQIPVPPVPQSKAPATEVTFH